MRGLVKGGTAISIAATISSELEPRVGKRLQPQQLCLHGCWRARVGGGRQPTLATKCMLRWALSLGRGDGCGLVGRSAGVSSVLVITWRIDLRGISFLGGCLRARQVGETFPQRPGDRHLGSRDRRLRRNRRHPGA